MDRIVKIHTPFWSIPILALGTAESVVPSARVVIAETSRTSESVAAVPRSLSPKASAGVQDSLLRQPVVDNRQARPTVASTDLEKSGSVGAVDSASVSIAEEYRQPVPDKRQFGTTVSDGKVGVSAEPGEAGSLPAAVDLAATSTTISHRPEIDAGTGAGISIPGRSGHQPRLESIRPADRRRLIYGTSARNADKVYFPQQFGQSVGTLNANAGKQLELLQPPISVGQANGDGHQVSAGRSPEETAGVPVRERQQPTTSGVDEEALQNGGYFEYESIAEPSVSDHGVVMAEAGAMGSAQAAAGEGDAGPPASWEPLVGTATSGLQQEMDDAA